nr:eukaryotic translation initiation factor 3 subunit J-like [Drosophila suzukii]
MDKLRLEIEKAQKFLEFLHKQVDSVSSASGAKSHNSQNFTKSDGGASKSSENSKNGHERDGKSSSGSENSENGQERDGKASSGSKNSENGQERVGMATNSSENSENRRERVGERSSDLGSKKDEEKPTKTEAPAKTKPSKALNAKLEQQARLEEEAEAERLANLSPEDKLAEKLRLQKIQEASDLKHAQDAFGVTSTSGGLDAFNPESKEEFKELGATISWKVAQFRGSEHFPQFVEDLVRSLCVNLSAADIKRVEMTVEILHSEKLKQGPEVRGIHGSCSVLKSILG